ncbi:NADPH:quinone oxidoreductase family protein [Afipia sp. DC4300-2b1]|uniref:NADPH:quinone oxidoreductase family protein n=1 Tax=Afipia sp. DC4300-2b1 TaxID=2804672 RepID=UPI003CEEE84C
MHAYQVVEHGDPSSLQLNEIGDLVPGKGQLLVGMRAAGINFPDVLVVSGKYQVLPKRPFTPGKDLAGVVLKVGPDVTQFAVGDRVLCHVEHGAFAEHVLVTPEQTFKLPDGLGFPQAAAMGLVYQTAYLALVDRGQYRKGETVLVGGAAGGIGLAAVQIAKGLGARVLAAVRTPEEATFVKANGADHVIDVSGPDIKDDLRAQVHAATGGAGADIVLDPLGGEFFSAALRAMAWCGRLVVIGFAAGEIPSLKVNYLLLKNISVCGLQWSDYRDRTPKRVEEVQADIFRLWRAGAVRPHLMKEYPFKELPVALDLIAQGKVRGKAVVVMDAM